MGMTRGRLRPRVLLFNRVARMAGLFKWVGWECRLDNFFRVRQNFLALCGVTSLGNWSPLDCAHTGLSCLAG